MLDGDLRYELETAKESLEERLRIPVGYCTCSEGNLMILLRRCMQRLYAHKFKAVEVLISQL